MNVSVNEKFPKELWNIILDYKKQFEKIEKCKGKAEKNIKNWIAGPYIHSDHKNKLSVEEYFEYFMKKEEIRKYISGEELKKLISDTRSQCFYWYSD